MSLATRLIVFLLPFILMGCGYFHSPSIIQGRDKHYLTAHSIQPVRILPGMPSTAFRNHYPISDRDYADNTKMVSILPPGL